VIKERKMTKATTTAKDAAKAAVQKAIETAKAAASDPKPKTKAKKAKGAPAASDPKKAPRAAASDPKPEKSALVDPSGCEPATSARTRGSVEKAAEKPAKRRDPRGRIARAEGTGDPSGPKETQTEAMARSISSIIKRLREHHAKAKLWGAPTKTLLKDLTSAIAVLEGAAEEAGELPRDLPKLARDEKLRTFNADRSKAAAEAEA
jgi:hypothetical protein